jgi:group I intron endonuclease
MYSVYFIVSEKTEFIYIGMTKNKLSLRMAQHRSVAKRGKKSPLYDCMRKHGPENFLIVLRETFETVEECQQSEINGIALARQEGWKILNLSDGGQTGYIVTDPEVRARMSAALSLARKDKKPALGMKHSKENKKKFSECGKARWDKYGRYPDEITQMCLKEANTKYGISKTHYYRLLKQRVSFNAAN